MPKTCELPAGCSSKSSDGDRASVEALNDVFAVDNVAVETASGFEIAVGISDIESDTLAKINLDGAHIENRTGDVYLTTRSNADLNPAVSMLVLSSLTSAVTATASGEIDARNQIVDSRFKRQRSVLVREPLRLRNRARQANEAGRKRDDQYPGNTTTVSNFHMVLFQPPPSNDYSELSRDFRSISSIFFLKLRGLMSVLTSLMDSRHSRFVPVLPASFQPSGFSLSAGQIEYCSS